MSDHLDAPGGRSPGMDPRLDICDIYTFQKPGDPDRSILVFNVNPFAPTGADEFHPEAVYELLIDTNGDAVGEIAYRFTFSSREGGEQFATLRRAEGDEVRSAGDGGEALFRDVPVNIGTSATVTEGAGHRLFIGMRSDPFFFDLAGYLNDMRFTGADHFLDKNVFSMVLELPNDALGNGTKVGIWARVLVPRDGDPFFQIDRMGRPFMNVAFTRGEDKDAFNRAEPARDRELFVERTAELLASNGHGQESAHQTALGLLPDILDYDTSIPTGYPNGRTLTDDIIDHQLALLTNGRVTSDLVGPHEDLLDDFPYLGPPHPVQRTVQAVGEPSGQRLA